MESSNVSGSGIGSNLKTRQVTDENSHVSADKRLRSPSHSFSSSGEVVQLGEHTAEEIPVSFMANSGQPSDGSTPIPPPQATEQPAGSSASEASDRIPSYVFARTSTAGPMEWSVASNESLFSIHTGNMSFSREQLNWMSKSGELGYTGDSTLSGPLPDIPSNQTPTGKSTEITNKSGNMTEGRYGVTEAAVAETMREVLRENESQQKENIAKESPHCRSMSQHSDASVKSFAFPILIGDADKNGSLRKCRKNKSQLSQSTTPKTTPQTPKQASHLETPKPEIPKSQTPNANRNADPRRWFSCFFCCSSCS